jgi:MYXO-CTERM domain-containing protein
MRRLAWLIAFAPATASAAVPADVGWHTLPSTTIESVCAATNGFDEVWGASGCNGIFAWSGGAWDSTRNRMIVTGGGHNDYYGNELYALDPEAGTMVRLTDPGLPTAPLEPCEEAVAGGTQPNSRHTYDGLEYIAHADRLYVFSGSLACGLGSWGYATWTYDFASETWERMDPTTGGDYPVGEAGMMTAYHPGRELVLLHDRRSLYSYDFDENQYTRLSGDDTYSGPGGYHHAAALDSKRELFVVVGWSSIQEDGRVYVYDVSEDSDYTPQELPTEGGDFVVDQSYPGLDYDPVSDRMIAWGGGGSVWALDLDTSQWTEHALDGGPGDVSAAGYGTHGRWRYSVELGYFVLVNEFDQDAWVLRFQPDAGMPGDDDGGSSSSEGSSDGSSGAPPSTSGVGTDESGEATSGAEPATTGSEETSSGAVDSADGGCGCRSSPRTAWPWALLILVFAPLTRRRDPR